MRWLTAGRAVSFTHSPVFNNLVSSQSHSGDKPIVVTNSPSLAEQTMIPSPTQSFNGSASSIASQTGSSDTARGLREIALKLRIWPLGATPAYWSMRRGSGTLF